jgi:hypothetical protein
MEKIIKEQEEVSVVRASLGRKTGLNIALFLLAVVIIVFGVYLSFQPEWAKRADIKLYNQGVSSLLLPAELLPATGDRPSEYPIIRAAAYFQQAASESTDNRLKALALYNLGTLMGKDALSALSGSPPSFVLADAIDKLTEVVRLNPDNEDAKYNLELFKALQFESTREQWLSDALLAMLTPAPGFFLGGTDKGF